MVSGINGGLNAGINVLYSGTVAAAIEGAFFGITSIAVLAGVRRARAVRQGRGVGNSVIEQILERKGPAAQLYNLNMPTSALTNSAEVRVVPMGVSRYGEKFEKRIDPRGRSYFWATSDPPPRPDQQETDITSLAEGYVTLTPLDFDLTKRNTLAEMQRWSWKMTGH